MSTIEGLLTEARNLESRGEFPEAIGRYDQALSELRASGAPPEKQAERELDLLYRRATARRFHGELDLALEDFQACATLAEAVERLDWEARARRALGEVHLRQKQIDVAVESFERSLTIAEDVGSAAEVLMTKARLARALCDRGRMEDAVGLAGDIASALREGAVSDASARTAIMSQTFIVLGVAAFKKGQGRRSRRFFQRALAHMDPERAMLPLAECRRYLGILESEAKNFLEATTALAEALKVYTKLGFDPGRFDCYLSLGLTYVDMGDLHNGRLCFEAAEKIARAGNMRAELARNQSRFADLEMRQGKYEAARAMYEEDLRLTRQTSDRQGLGYCHRNVAQACRAAGEYDAAREHALKSQEHFEATGRDHLAALSQLELAECDLARGQYDEALRQVEAAQTVLEQHGPATQPARIEVLHAKLLGSRDEHDRALKHFDRAIDAYLRQPPTRELAETRFQAAVACRRAGQDRAALEHLRNAVSLAETLGCRDIRQQSLRMMDEIDVVDAQRVKLAPYMPSGAVDELSTEWESIDQRKDRAVATVMFVDMRDYTTLSGRIDEGELVETVEGFLSLVVRTVRQNDGTVDKFIGDCVMATFGFRQTPEQGARMALWTGLEILEQLSVVSDVREHAGAGPLHASMGINTGPLVSGCFGPLEKRDYTVVGYHVNLAARLQSLAGAVTHGEPSRLVISDSTFQLAPHIAAVRAVESEELSLKGIDVSTLKAWLVTGRAWTGST